MVERGKPDSLFMLTSNAVQNMWSHRAKIRLTYFIMQRWFNFFWTCCVAQTFYRKEIWCETNAAVLQKELFSISQIIKFNRTFLSGQLLFHPKALENVILPDSFREHPAIDSLPCRPCFQWTVRAQRQAGFLKWLGEWMIFLKVELQRMESCNNVQWSVSA